MRVFVDSNVPLHATGRDSPLREPARRALRLIGAGELDAVTSSEVLQEVLHRGLRHGERPATLQRFDEFARLLAGRVLPVDALDIVHARALAERHPGLDGRDLVHLAVMARHGVTTILTSDREFDGVEGVTRLDPRDVMPPA